jgi:hypothetical protein
MARFFDPLTKQVSEIGSPELNPELIKGKFQIPNVGVITPDLIKDSTPINFQVPQESSIFPVAGLNATTNQAELLPQEKEQSDIIKRTQALMDQLSGKTTFQAQKETELGITEFTKTQRDLETRLKGLQAEALAIPLRLQQEFEGRGITAGGLAPIQAGELRKNAIQALSVSSLLEASRGNLMTALDLVDRAVAQKYDPIEARINANLKNLDLLSKDPALTLAQKNRLEAQQKIQQAKKEENDLAKNNEEEAKKKALEYASVANSLTLDQMSKAKTALEVTQIAQSKGLKTLVEQKAEQEQLKTEAETTKIKAETEKISKQIISSTDKIILPKIGIGGNDIKFIPSSTLTAQQKLKINTVVAGIDLMKKAEELYNEATGTEYQGFGSGVLARLKGLGRFGGAFIGISEKWQAYQNFLDSNRAPIAKGIKGEVGNLAEQEQKNALKSFPSIFSSPYEAKVAFDTIRSQALSNIKTLGSVEEIASGSQETANLNISQEQLQELKDLNLLP